MQDELLDNILPDISKISEEVGFEKINEKPKKKTKSKKNLNVENLSDEVIEMREVLAKITMGGQSQFYLGKKYLVADINNLNDSA